jgi:hypothetical protein
MRAFSVSELSVLQTVEQKASSLLQDLDKLSNIPAQLFPETKRLFEYLANKLEEPIAVRVNRPMKKKQSESTAYNLITIIHHAIETNISLCGFARIGKHKRVAFFSTERREESSYCEERFSPELSPTLFECHLLTLLACFVLEKTLINLSTDGI